MSTTTIQVSPSELGERLKQELTVTDWRAVVAVIVAPPGLEQAAEQVCSAAISAFGLSEDEVVRWAAHPDDAARDQLRAINRGRDTLLRVKRLIWLRTSSAADVRLLRKLAPDLTSAIDLFLELRTEVQVQPDWPACSSQLRALMEDRHAMLDFTGLLPASVDPRKLPLVELYQPLVDPRTADRGLEQERSGLLVLGHPGTGKTTFVRHLAWTYARGRDDPLEIGTKVPLLLSLSDYGYEREHDRVSSLVDFLPRWLTEQGVEQASSLPANLPDILLLLDGLDEIRDAHARLSVLGEVSALVREKHVGGAVVTGRSFLVDELRQDDMALRLASTREPTWEEIGELLTQLVKLRGGSADQAKDLVRRVDRDRDLRALARNPLVLTLMAILDELEGRLPDRRIEIYSRLGEMLVERWTRARSSGSSAHRREGTTRADALRVLGPLAWWAVEQGGGAVREEELSKEIERIEARREAPAEASRRATALLERLRSDTAMLVPQPRRRWSFVHSSIAEYLAGVEAERDHERWRDLLDDPFRPEWREIVIFCAGQLGVIHGRMTSLDALVTATIAKSRRSRRHDVNHPMLFIGLLAEPLGLSKRQIEAVAQQLFEKALTRSYSPNSAYQMQRALISLLIAARGAVEEALVTSLETWLSELAPQIDWEGLMNVNRGGTPKAHDLASMHFDVDTGSVAYDFVLGPFVTWLCEWIPPRNIDIDSILSLWRSSPDWRYRLAEWYAMSDEAARQRPFAAVIQELGLAGLA